MTPARAAGSGAAFATPEVKGPVGLGMQLFIYSTWPNPPRPLVWHYCNGCEAERLWFDCDVYANERVGGTRYCRDCQPVNVPYVPHPYDTQPNRGAWEGC